MEDVDLTDGNLLLDKMVINLHMLSALMLNEVAREVHNVDVVAVDKGASRRQTLELMVQLAQPGGSAMPLATTRYSASELDQETTICRLADEDNRCRQ
jgi:hypothetical protein